MLFPRHHSAPTQGEQWAATSTQPPVSPKRCHQEHKGGFLPPMSIAVILGMMLFAIYIGSAVISVLLPVRSGSSGFGGVGAMYSRQEEKAYCSQIAQNPPPFDPCFAPAHPSNRTIFLQPYGGMGNRLRGVASALTIAREVDANVVIVWTDKEHGFRGQWDELLEAPKIPIGCFPGTALREDHARCTVRRVNHWTEWEQVKGKFEVQRGGQEVLCLQSMMFLTKKQLGIGWFYRLLRPAAAVVDTIVAFQKRVQWEEWGQWVGVHIRRTDLKLKCNTDDCHDGMTASEVLPLKAYTKVLEDLAHLRASSKDKTRFFLATDDPYTEDEVRRTMRRTANLTEESGQVISFSKHVRDSADNALAMRNTVEGTAEGLVDAWLLSRTQALVGTVGSSYSQTAMLMGGMFYLSVGANEYENSP